MPDEFSYRGEELDLFAHARHWKAYWGARVAPFLRGDVLEVGAGSGNNADLLARCDHQRWLSLEPDPALCTLLEQRRAAAPVPGWETATGVVADLPDDASFDAILYADVLEHIEDDVGELARAATRLRPGGHLVVLSPAHPFLYSAFDRAVGHHRRYRRRSMRACGPPDLQLLRIEYLDAVGLLASGANRLLLKQSNPTLAQIKLWDRCMVPLSRLLDPLTAYRLGKSILAVWRAPV